LREGDFWILRGRYVKLVPHFTRYIGIDYSGAETADSSCKGIRVFMAEGSGEPIGHQIRKCFLAEFNKFQVADSMRR
jgi:hypothetical protein